MKQQRPLDPGESAATGDMAVMRHPMGQSDRYRVSTPNGSSVEVDHEAIQALAELAGFEVRDR